MWVDRRPVMSAQNFPPVFFVYNIMLAPSITAKISISAAFKYIVTPQRVCIVTLCSDILEADHFSLTLIMAHLWICTIHLQLVSYQENCAFMRSRTSEPYHLPHSTGDNLLLNLTLKGDDDIKYQLTKSTPIVVIYVSV